MSVKEPGTVTAKALELTPRELEEQWSIFRFWVDVCPYCEQSHPVTCFPGTSDAYIAECRLGGLMVITEIS